MSITTINELAEHIFKHAHEMCVKAEILQLQEMLLMEQALAQYKIVYDRTEITVEKDTLAVFYNYVLVEEEEDYYAHFPTMPEGKYIEYNVYTTFNSKGQLLSLNILRRTVSKIPTDNRIEILFDND